MDRSESGEFCLKWNNFQSNITSQFETLRADEDFLDVTFACSGQFLGAHKIVLSACSPYFKRLFKNNPCPHPVIFMHDIGVCQVRALLEFMYLGEVNIAQDELSLFLKTAEALQIRGLTEAASKHNIMKESIRDPELKSFSKEQFISPPSSPKNKNKIKSTDVQTHNFNALTELNESGTPINIKTENIYGETDIEIHEMATHESESSSQNNVMEGYIDSKLEQANYSSNDEILMHLDFASIAAAGFDSTANTSYPTQNLQNLSKVRPQSALLRQPAPASSNENSSRRRLSSSDSSNQPNHQQRRNYSTSVTNATATTLHSLERRPCPICGRVYSNHSNLRQHINLIHSPESMTCPLCGKTFRTRLYLRRHLASFHNSPIAQSSRFANSQNSNFMKNNPAADHDSGTRFSNDNVGNSNSNEFNQNIGAELAQSKLARSEQSSGFYRKFNGSTQGATWCDME